MSAEGTGLDKTRCRSESPARSAVSRVSFNSSSDGVLDAGWVSETSSSIGSSSQGSLIKT